LARDSRHPGIKNAASLLAAFFFAPDSGANWCLPGVGDSA